jgi:hypothetical protein
VVTHGAAALEKALAEPPAVLVVQLGLPLIDGAQLGGILHANPRTGRVGVVYLADTAADAARSDLGENIIEPPADPDVVAQRVHSLLEDRSQEGETDTVDSDESGGVDGQLSQLPLADLLQLFHVSQKTGVVEVKRQSARTAIEIGRVLVRGGDIVHAQVGSATGAKALFRLLAWKRGDFSFRPGIVTVESTMEKPTRTLLRDGVRQVEAWSRRAVRLPPMDASVHLKVRRASLPIVIHPLTQEVLLVLEAYSRVRDVVDHCSFPDYQVLRTLHTLIDRGMVELHHEEAATPRAGRAAGLVSRPRCARLKEWIGLDPARQGENRDAKLLVVAPDVEASRAFSRLIERLPGVTLADPRNGGPVERLGPLGHLALDETVGIELLEVPTDSRFAPIWPLAGYGAVGILLLLSGSVEGSVEAMRPVSEVLRRLPRARIFHLLMLEKGTGVEPEALRENLSLFDDSSLFLIPAENSGTATVLLREMFVRILP